jgi:hypothetical protein
MSDPSRLSPPNGPGLLTATQQELIDVIQDLNHTISTMSGAGGNNTGTVGSSGGTQSLTGLFGQAGARGKAGMAYKDAISFGTKEVQERAAISAENFRLTRRLSSEIDSIHSLIGSLEAQTKFFDDQRKNRIAADAAYSLHQKNRFDNDLKGMQKFQMILLGNVSFAKNIYMKQMKELDRELIETRKVRLTNRKVLEAIDKDIGYQKANQDVVSAIEDKFGYVGKLFGGFKNRSADKEEMLTENRNSFAQKLKFQENKTRAQERFRRAKPGSSEYNALRAQLGAYDEQDAYDRNPVMDESDARVFKDNSIYQNTGSYEKSISLGRSGEAASFGPGANRDGSPNKNSSKKTTKGKLKPTKNDILLPTALPGEQTLFLTNAFGITDLGAKGGLYKNGSGDAGGPSGGGGGGGLDSIISLFAGGGIAAALKTFMDGLKNKFTPKPGMPTAPSLVPPAPPAPKPSNPSVRAPNGPKFYQKTGEFRNQGRYAPKPEDTRGLKYNLKAQRWYKPHVKGFVPSPMSTRPGTLPGPDSSTPPIAENPSFLKGLKGAVGTAGRYLVKGLPIIGAGVDAAFTASDINTINASDKVTDYEKNKFAERSNFKYLLRNIGGIGFGALGALAGTAPSLGVPTPLTLAAGLALGVLGNVLGDNLADVLYDSGMYNAVFGEPAGKPKEGKKVEDAYIESNGTIHYKDPRDKILFFQDPNTIEIVKNTKSESKQESASGSVFSNDTMVELLQSILKELKYSNNKKTITPKMDILGGKNLLMGSM